MTSHPTPATGLAAVGGEPPVTRAARRPSLADALGAIALGGLAAGILDLGAALIQASIRGLSATRLLQAIASGLLGTPSYEGGLATAALGLAAHFSIAFTAAAVFVLTVRRVPFLVSIMWLSGPVYGMLVWATMRFVVLPLSAYPHLQSVDTTAMAVAVAIHMFCVGLPIAAAARVMYPQRR